jgi:hypothetical protein
VNPLPRTGHIEVLKGRIYDTLFLPDNMPNDKGYLFLLPLGQYAGRKIKQIEHTNMLQPGMIFPESFSIRQLKCAFYQGGEFVSADSDLYEGDLQLMTVPDHLETRFTPLSMYAAADCRSVIATPPSPYTNGWRDYEDKHHPVIMFLETHRAFHILLTLKNKPDVPTEFVCVLCGDHQVAVYD